MQNASSFVQAKNKKSDSTKSPQLSQIADFFHIITGKKKGVDCYEG